MSGEGLEVVSRSGNASLRKSDMVLLPGVAVRLWTNRYRQSLLIEHWPHIDDLDHRCSVDSHLSTPLTDGPEPITLTIIACQQKSPSLYQSDAHHRQQRRCAVITLKSLRNATGILTKTIATSVSKKNAEAITGVGAE
jgi:hypothetical protein